MDGRWSGLQISAAKRTLDCIVVRASMMLQLMKRNSQRSNLGLSREDNIEIYQQRPTDRRRLQFPESIKYRAATAAGLQISLFHVLYRLHRLR